MIIKVNGTNHLPIPGDPTAIYVDTVTESRWRWNGSVYVTEGYASAGTKALATVTAEELGNSVVHRTRLTLTDTPITLTDDAGAGQYGSIELYDFPAGNVMTLGAVVDADITLNEAWWVDASPGDVGIGSAAVTDGDALATTEQNIIATTEIAALTAQAGPIDAQSTGVMVSGAAGGTDAVAYLNIRIDDDAAHMPDVVSNGAFTTDETGWTLGEGWAMGTAKIDATTASTAMSQAVTLVAGVAYKLTYTTTRSAGSVRPTLGGTLGTARSTADTFTETIIPVTNSGLSFTGTGFTGSIDTVSCVPLTGSGKITGTVDLVWSNLGDM